MRPVQCCVRRLGRDSPRSGRTSSTTGLRASATRQGRPRIRDRASLGCDPRPRYNHSANRARSIVRCSQLPHPSPLQRTRDIRLVPQENLLARRLTCYYTARLRHKACTNGKTPHAPSQHCRAAYPATTAVIYPSLGLLSAPVCPLLISFYRFSLPSADSFTTFASAAAART